jgi:NADP-dependent 3-hydroxy acid dehydrogenase YdfG
VRHDSSPVLLVCADPPGRVAVARPGRRVESRRSRLRRERIDTLFVNAGSTVPTPMQAISADTFDAMIDVHIKGPFFLI